MNLKKLISTMTLDQKVGQIITYEFVGNRIRPDTWKKIEELHCGGLRITPHVLEAIPYHKRFDKSAPTQQRLAYHATPDYYAGVIARLQEIAKKRPLGIPLHISIDQEGDFSCDYARGGVNLLPSAMGMAAYGDLKGVYEAYRAVGRQLRAIGSSMIHSPVLDVNMNPQNPEICTRSFGDDPETAAAFAEACMKGLMAGGLIPTAKHFPGRGNSAVDLHYDADADPRSLEEFEKTELVPYRKLIAAGLPAIMVSHQSCPAFGGENKPATVSASIYRFIRESLGFQGVITTDAMGMKGVLALFGSLGQACAESAACGADLVLAKCHPSLEQEVFDWIKRYVEEGRITMADLDAKVGRVLAMKGKQGLWGRYFEPAKAARVAADPGIRKSVEKAARKSIVLARDGKQWLPLDKSAKVLVVEPCYREWQSKGFDNFYHPGMLSLFMDRHSRNVTFFETDISVSAEDEAEALRLSDAHDFTVVNSFFWRSCPTNAVLVRKLIERGRRVIVVAGAPYENICVPEAETVVVNWGQVPECQRAAADLLYGKLKPAGKWPLKNYKIRGIK